VLLGGSLLLLFFGQTILQTLAYEMKHLFVYRVPSEITVTYLSQIANGLGMRIAVVVIPVLLAMLLLSVAANVMQGGLGFRPNPLAFILKN
jgi:flagellar biosynthesis protein FlhB